MIGISIFGAGRMGHIYAQNVAAHAKARLVNVFTPRLSSAQKLAEAYGGYACDDAEKALDDPSVDAVIICTPTASHLDYICQAAQKGKAILCEKPLDIHLQNVEKALESLSQHATPFMLGFNRRFDPDIHSLHQKISQKAIGDLNLLILTSRDPAPPPQDYIKTSGGYFVDSTIHDIDLACWLCGEYPIEVFSAGSCMVDDAIGQLGDVDTAMTILKMPSGCLCHINNSRRSAYGFDQRIEAFGSKGMLQSLNQHNHNLCQWNSEYTKAQSPLKPFFLERYEKSFMGELDEFLASILEKRPPIVTEIDGRNALAIALACQKSCETGRMIKL